MKKLIAVILTLLMLFSLTACGGDTIIGSSLSFNVKGYGKKKLTVTVTDKFDKDYTLEYIQCDEDSQYYQVALTNEAEGSHSYEITPVAVGNHTFAIKFVASDELLGTASLNVYVLEDGKMYYDDLSLYDITDEQVSLSDDMQISNDDGPIQVIQLSGENGDWIIGKYDDAIVDVAGPDYSDGNILSFRITAVGEGSTTVYLDNETAMLQLALNFTSTKADTSAGSDEYILKFIDFLTTSLSEEQDETIYDAYKKAQEVNQEAAKENGGSYDALNIPEDAIVDDVYYYENPEKKSDTEKGTEGSETTGSAVGSEKIDIVNYDDTKPDILSDITFTYGGVIMDYQTSATFTKASYCEDLTGPIDKKTDAAEGVSIQEEKDIVIGSHEVKYYYLTEGCAIAVWEQSGVASRLTFTDGSHSSTEYQETLDLLLSADAL